MSKFLTDVTIGALTIDVATGGITTTGAGTFGTAGGTGLNATGDIAFTLDSLDTFSVVYGGKTLLNIDALTMGSQTWYPLEDYGGFAACDLGAVASYRWRDLFLGRYIYLLESGASPTYYHILKGGDITGGANITWTLPATVPSANSQALLGTTAGVMSWGTNFGANDILTTGTLGAGAITGKSFTIGTDAGIDATVTYVDTLLGAKL
jgi:hypothetical protein